MTTSGYGAEPRAHPQARGLTILLGIILVGLSTVLGRDLWMALQYEDRRGWLEPVYDFLASFPVGTPAVAGGIVVTLVGLWLIWMAFAPRLRPYVRMKSSASIWMRPVDIARKSTATTKSEVGVADISSRADRKRLAISVGDDGTGDALLASIPEALRPELELLDPPPAIKVNVIPEDPKEVL